MTTTELKSLSTKDLLDQYNAITGVKPLKGWSESKDALIKRITAASSKLAPVLAPKLLTAETVAASKKSTKKTEELGKRERLWAQRREQSITLLAEGNPRRPGSETYKIYELYKDGMTVGAFIDAGGRWIDVLADVARGHIKLTAPKKTA